MKTKIKIEEDHPALDVVMWDTSDSQHERATYRGHDLRVNHTTPLETDDH